MNAGKKLWIPVIDRVPPIFAVPSDRYEAGQMKVEIDVFLISETHLGTVVFVCTHVFKIFNFQFVV